MRFSILNALKWGNPEEVHLKTRLTVVLMAFALIAGPALAQNPQRRATPARPAPRWPDGRLNLGTPPGEIGLWAPAGIVQLSVNPNSVNRAGANTHLPNNIKIEDVPFQPWARALHAAREAAFESDEAHTLVVDSVGFNERFWIDREGTPHTEQLHLIERFSRPDFNTLQYEVTVDDPGAYTAIWTGGFLLRWSAGTELFEYVCQDNNKSPEAMVGTGDSVSRTSPIVP